jgi:hypothetical protein
MDFSGITAFVLALLVMVFQEFLKGFSNNAGAQLSNTIARRTKPRKKKKTWFRKLISIIILTGIIWVVIKFYPLIFSLI